MYAYIKGIIDSISDGSVVLDNGGIGYNIHVANSVLAELPSVGHEVKLYTYTYVKEDAFALYGFGSPSDKDMFLKLISVSGVGCKGAMTILSGLDSNALAIAISNQDVVAISAVKGVGKKTAERIIIELKSKVDLSAMSLLGGKSTIVSSDAIADESIMALMALGITKNEATNAVAKVRNLANNAEKLITLALRNLN